ncbi:MAG: hypothetical protein AAGA54_07495 [Myxococcota bacterium]
MRSALPLALVALVGCPAEVKDTAPAPKTAPKPVVDESDPRVVKQGNDLYAADALPEEKAPEKGKGSGKPDETNGFCRLYAPKMTEPHCCNIEHGFDAVATGQACGKGLYLGESFQRSCGYFFLDNASGEPVWFRSSFVEEANAKVAAEAEANRIKMRFGDEIPVEAVEGQTDAFTIAYNGIHYAYMGGDKAWNKVRRLAWKDESCSDEGIATVVGQMVEAKAPATGQLRLGLVPKAR